MVTVKGIENQARLFRSDYRRLTQVRTALQSLTRDVRQGTGHRASWVRRLGDLRDQLAVHFALEEAHDFSGEICAAAPHLAARAERLTREHVKLYDRICQIVEAAERQLLAGDRTVSERFASFGPDGDALARLVRRVQEFERRLAAHEADDDALLLDAIDTDYGGGD